MLHRHHTRGADLFQHRCPSHHNFHPLCEQTSHSWLSSLLKPVLRLGIQSFAGDQRRGTYRLVRGLGKTGWAKQFSLGAVGKVFVCVCVTGETEKQNPLSEQTIAKSRS